MLNFSVALSWISLRAEVLNWGNFTAQGTFGSVCSLFWLSQVGVWEYYWHLVGRGQGCHCSAQHSPHNEGVPGPKRW